ncbi:hypothetical protein [Chromobacterium subtsugae]|uniref:hypothetical protein n=1 Tax=Chromobacterium subtsugae TaxID=251747 RepID=UPI0007F8ABBC|nr:hypothetical protein [Chromobacterium subtsugae]OBU85248.1 hypothetical protein MY55_17220 [Chromobacterium subtsugae]
MTLPVNGTLSAREVNVEVSRPGAALGNAGEPVFRALAEVGDSGSYSAMAFYGKNVIKPLTAALSTYLDESTFVVGIGRPRVYVEVTCTPGGGVPPYAYAWEMLSEDRGHPFYSGEATNKILFSGDPKGYGSTWRCRVTDSQGKVAYSPVLTLVFKYRKLG